jgi:C4-dicarboxylate-specific signal transduction histidine kinase
MDWLGMDLRRVSEVGTRLSTSQVIGYISITAEGNPDLKDTSNRESLRDDIASRDFYDAIMEVIRNLERLRKDNRNETEKEMPFRELFEQLSPKSLISKVNEMAARGETARAVMPEIEEYGQSVERSVAVIEKRLVHYSRLATIGALAAMVMHEIRNRTVIFGSFVEKITEYFKKSNLNFEKLAKHTQLAESAIYTLQRMADKFAPLANRSFGKRRRDCFLEEIIDECVEMRTQDIEKKGITVEYPKGKKNYLAVDLGDLSAILLNLFDNSIYWLSGTEKGKRKIAISYQLIDKGTRVRIHFDDSGPGISKDHIEKVFWPGVTTRQDGLGMGLTVAAELVDQYGGKMTAVDHGTLKGAGFIFDLPLSERE